MSPEYCVVDIARHRGAREGLLAADHAMFNGASRESMARLTVDMQLYPGITTARWVVEKADPRSESPLETLGRMAFLAAGLPPPLSNIWIPTGYRWYRVDHLLPESGVIIEADGAKKYNDKPDAAELVTRDRERERALRSAGYEIVRYTWRMAVGRPGEILYRARQAAATRGTRRPPSGWTLENPYTARAKMAALGLE